MALNKIGILRFFFFSPVCEITIFFHPHKNFVAKERRSAAVFPFHTWADRDPAVSEGTLDSRAPSQHPLLVPGQRKHPRGSLRGHVWSLPRALHPWGRRSSLRTPFRLVVAQPHHTEGKEGGNFAEGQEWFLHIGICGNNYMFQIRYQKYWSIAVLNKKQNLLQCVVILLMLHFPNGYP